MNISLNSEIDSTGLYSSQIEALKVLAQWWNSPEKEAVIEGFAGTGKTFLIKHFLNNFVKKTFCVTTPTHKALSVIEEQIGAKGLTLQSLHGLRPNTEISTFDINKLEFESLGAIKMRNYSLIIIDEASMINSSLFNLTRLRSKEYNVKVLYLGDRYQLPPVGENISKIFTDVKTRIVLDKIIRQESHNPLLKVFDLLRKDIDNSTNTALEYLAKHPSKVRDGVGYEVLNAQQYRDKLIEYFKRDEFYRNVDFVRATSFTNTMTSVWNKIIRTNIFETQGKSLILDDLLTAYKTIVDDHNNPIIINSQDYIIEDIRPYVNSFRLKVDCVVLKSLQTKKTTEMLQIINVDDINNIDKYRNIIEALRVKAKAIGGKKGWYPFFKFKNSILSMSDVKLSDVSLNREIDYGYCLTTHKLQGSTLDNVFVDGDDICNPITKYGNRMKQETVFKNRLLYVALSRTRNMAFIKF